MTPLAVPVLPWAERIEGGGIDAAGPLSMGVCAAGIRPSGSDDLLLMHLPGAVFAAVTTASTAAAAPCRWTRSRVPARASAVVVNAGNANASTGAQGEADVVATAEKTAALLGCPADEVLICSTGVIGHPLPMAGLLAGLETVAGTMDASAERASRAIMTTDLVPKTCAFRSGAVVVGGMAKGSGMIHPNMATMLGFFVTNADAEPADLQALLEQLVPLSFNAITVDGDESTNDTVILAATGQGPKLAPGQPGWEDLELALSSALRDLAMAIARDGEGATVLVEVLVEGTDSDARARELARVVGRSPLVKTAVHGRDPNWGRVVAALGAARAQGLAEMDLDWGGLPVLRGGTPVPVEPEAAAAAVAGSQLLIHIRLPGVGVGRAWGCDLSDGYVRINADYTS